MTGGVTDLSSVPVESRFLELQNSHEFNSFAGEKGQGKILPVHLHLKNKEERLSHSPLHCGLPTCVAVSWHGSCDFGNQLSQA